jgi:hypothetical protein
MLSRPSQANRTVKGERSASHRRASGPGTRIQSRVEYEYDPSFIQRAAHAVRTGQEKVFLDEIASEEDVD